MTTSDFIARATAAGWPECIVNHVVDSTHDIEHVDADVIGVHTRSGSLQRLTKNHGAETAARANRQCPPDPPLASPEWSKR